MPSTDTLRAEPETGVRGGPGLARSLLFCLFLLLALEGLARWGLPVVAASEMFYDQRALMVLAERPRDGSRVVWLVGDSTVIGLDVAPAETPGPVLEKVLRKIKPGIEVRTVGNAGMGLDNAEELVGRLPLRPADVVLVSTHLAHATDYHDYGWGERSVKTWQDRVERAALRQAERLALVRHRHYVSRLPMLLGRNGLLPQKIGFRLRRTQPGPVRRELWTSGRLPAADLKSLTVSYGTIDEGTAEAIHGKLARLEAFLKARDVAFMTYVSPLNRAIVERYGYAEWEDLRSAAAEVCDLGARSGMHCLNLVDAIPSGYFYDDDHVTAGGYRLLVSKLVPPLAQLL